MLLVRVWQERQQTLRALVTAVLPNQALVEDVLQESFARLLKKRRDFSTTQEAFWYVRTSVLNTAIDFYRQFRRQASRQCGEDISVRPFASGEENPLGRLLQKEEAGERRIILREVRAALTRLPEAEREALEIYFGSRRSTTLKDYCAERGLSYSTLHSRMLKGIDRIRLHLSQKGIRGFGSGESE